MTSWTGLYKPRYEFWMHLLPFYLDHPKIGSMCTRVEGGAQEIKDGIFVLAFLLPPRRFDTFDFFGCESSKQGINGGSRREKEREGKSKRRFFSILLAFFVP